MQVASRCSKRREIHWQRLPSERRRINSYQQDGGRDISRGSEIQVQVHASADLWPATDPPYFRDREGVSRCTSHTYSFYRSRGRCSFDNPWVDIHRVLIVPSPHAVPRVVLFAIEIAGRAGEIVGATSNSDSRFMAQITRNLTDPLDGFLSGKRFFRVDRDGKFDARLCRIPNDAGVDVMRTTFRAPDMNAFAQRVVRGLEDERLSRMIFLDPGMPHRPLGEFVAHDRSERNHQGRDNALFEPGAQPMPIVGPVFRRERLGGLSSFCHRLRLTGRVPRGGWEEGSVLGFGRKRPPAVRTEASGIG